MVAKACFFAENEVPKWNEDKCHFFLQVLSFSPSALSFSKRPFVLQALFSVILGLNLPKSVEARNVSGFTYCVVMDTCFMSQSNRLFLTHVLFTLDKWGFVSAKKACTVQQGALTKKTIGHKVGFSNAWKQGRSSWQALCQYRPQSASVVFPRWRRPRQTFATGWKQTL